MHNTIQKKNNLNRGFSLVEMLVAIGIFMTIMTIAVSSLISIIGANKKAQAIKGTIDSVTFAIESISKDMRIGSGYKCLLNGDFTNIGCPLDIGSTAVQFLSGSNIPTTYMFNGTSTPTIGILTKTECPPSLPCSTADLISQDSNVNISSMKFYVIGANNELNIDPSLRTQPRVVITASGIIATKGSADTSFNLQTSVSQRIRR
jgi:type II secretory pathway pseudopilin PulG